MDIDILITYYYVIYAFPIYISYKLWSVLIKPNRILERTHFKINAFNLSQGLVFFSFLLLLCFDIGDLCKEIKNSGKYISIDTNGTN